MQLARRLPEPVARVLGGPRHQSRSQIRRRGRPAGAQDLQVEIVPADDGTHDPGNRRVPKQNVPHRVQRRVERRIPRFFAKQVAVPRPGVQVPQLPHVNGREAAAVHARYRRQEHTEFTVSLQVGFLRFREARKRPGEAVDPVPGRELLRPHAGAEGRPAALRPLGLRWMNTGLPGSLRTSNPLDFVTSVLRLEQP